MLNDYSVEDLDEVEAKKELIRLNEILDRANSDYYNNDAPNLSDSEYDILKKRNSDIELRFPNLKLQNSVSNKVGSKPSNSFKKIKHSVKMLSLANGFDEQDIIDFDHRIKKLRELFTRLNIIKKLDNKLETWHYETLDETSRIAKEIKKRLT